MVAPRPVRFREGRIAGPDQESVAGGKAARVDLVSGLHVSIHLEMQRT